SGVDEVGVLKGTDRVLVAIDPRYYRPTEVDTLLGDPTKAKTKLGWQPRTTFRELIREMVHSDVAEAQRDAMVRREGFRQYESIEELSS
ncbi:MAG TPA: GDP-mannose 4,6-dehydratase, partial [Armatimonadetes bacterium]|nr:GDP-mannose 4,6-dehydratase [Armatimonadota bacterium]